MAFYGVIMVKDALARSIGYRLLDVDLTWTSDYLIALPSYCGLHYSFRSGRVYDFYVL